MSMFGHIIGVIGMICVTIAFYWVVDKKWKPDGLVYNVVNLTGGILLLISLFIHFNAGSFAIEIFWIGISLKGLYSYYKTKGQVEYIDHPSTVQEFLEQFEKNKVRGQNMVSLATLKHFAKTGETGLPDRNK